LDLSAFSAKFQAFAGGSWPERTVNARDHCLHLDFYSDYAGSGRNDMQSRGEFFARVLSGLG